MHNKPRKPTGFPRYARTSQTNRQYGDFHATELYCPKCGRATPVRERLLLILPEGEKYEYLCALCGTSVGDKVKRGERQPILVV